MLSVTWVVNSVTDVSSWSETDSILSLREALGRSGDGDKITFAASVAGKTITLRYGQLNVATSVDIDASEWANPENGTYGVKIDAIRRNRVFDVATGLTVRVAGIHIVNGYAGSEDGGAIQNKGILTVDGCSLQYNQANYGGGIYNFHGEMTITNTHLDNNTGTAHGGGVYVYWGSATMTDCTVDNNIAGTGGGVDSQQAAVTMIRCSVSGNKTNNVYTFAGGIFLLYGSMTMMDCKVMNNSTQNYAGGICNYWGTLIMTNSLIAGNSTQYYGGGIENYGPLTLTQCTVTGNTTSGDYSIGAGINNATQATMNACNTIIAGNISASGSSEQDMSVGGITACYNVLSSQSLWNTSQNFFAYDASRPLFTNPSGGDYSLAQSSQALDIGYNGNAVYPTGEWIEYDLAGKTRIANGIVDLGAFELQKAVPLEVPTNIRVTAAGLNRVRVTWNIVENAEEYILAYSTDQTNWTTRITTGITQVVTGLPYARIYYKVMAVGDGFNYSNSAYSAPVSAWVCPMDVDGDQFIGITDLRLITDSWFASAGQTYWDERCDVDGDGFIGPGDRNFLSVNWFKMASGANLVYPNTNPIAAPLPNRSLAEERSALNGILFRDADAEFFVLPFASAPADRSKSFGIWSPAERGINPVGPTPADESILKKIFSAAEETDGADLFVPVFVSSEDGGFSSGDRNGLAIDLTADVFALLY